MKRKKGEEGKAPSIFRCDKLPTHMNAGKIQTLKVMLKAWRRSAKVIADLQWNCFFQDGASDSFFDPSTVHRKQGADARRGILRQISLHFGVEPTVFKKKRLPKMIPGLVDALEPLKAVLGAAEVQMVREQVLETLNSYISNRQNDFRQAVFGSCLSNEEYEAKRHALLVINKAKAWFNLKRELQIDGTPIDMRTRRLARNIMSQIMNRHRKPRFTRIGMVVDQRIATLSTSTSGTSFDMWIKLRIAGLRETRKAAGQKSRMALSTFRSEAMTDSTLGEASANSRSRSSRIAIQGQSPSV
ncbi:hypothetical protein [Rhizobium sp. MHM7A]|uniref:hypothetical protein n=1 Tax=Rhizobium sp. MHM7A TaxID=2583233 RepID=UPI0011060577|nr:hypothetical protein [Rhizobium sp. MHM7A]